MSLLKQLFLAICLFLVVAFAGSFAASLESSREQMISQLRSHAQDAATALGLSLTPHVDDPAMIELMVSSIFDSGYFATIRVVSIPEGKVIVERESDTQNQQVPAWFAKLVNLKAQGGDALIMRGWEQAARVEVVSHPQFALAKLWDGALGSLAWLLACGLVSAVLGGWLLRTQLKPLDQMVQQAHAITRHEFLTLPKEPRTPELKRVVQAMNQMVDKLKALFAEEATRSEKLREEAYQDSLSGLANRRLFDARLDAQLSPSEQNAAGYLLLLRLNDLAGLNQRLGGQRTDALIRDVAELLERERQQHGTPDWLAARSRGGEFTLLAPGVDSASAELLADQLSAALENLRNTGASDCTPVAHLGLAAFRPGEAAASVLSRADQALAQSQSRRTAPGSAWTAPAASPCRTPAAGASGSTTPCTKASCSCGSSQCAPAPRTVNCCTRRSSHGCSTPRARPSPPGSSCRGSSASAGPRASTWRCSNTPSPTSPSNRRRWPCRSPRKPCAAPSRCGNCSRPCVPTRRRRS